MNQFVYFGANRRLLWSCLIPGIAVTIAGPLMAYGFGLSAVMTSGLILSCLAGAGRFSLEPRVWPEQRLEVSAELFDIFDQDLIALRGLRQHERALYDGDI